MPPVLFCQRCGAFQWLREVHVEPCARCGGTLFHHLHPVDRNAAWQAPPETQQHPLDADFLRLLAITGEAQ